VDRSMDAVSTDGGVATWTWVHDRRGALDGQERAELVGAKLERTELVRAEASGFVGWAVGRDTRVEATWFEGASVGLGGAWFNL
jgi:hypothetical protein